MPGLKKKVREFIKRFDAVDWYSVRIIPKGAGDPLPTVPIDVEITPEDVDRADREWNRLMPEAAGIMDAEVINKRDFDDG